MLAFNIRLFKLKLFRIYDSQYLEAKPISGKVSQVTKGSDKVHPQFIVNTLVLVVKSFSLNALK